jgi:hypothetical protein
MGSVRNFVVFAAADIGETDSIVRRLQMPVMIDCLNRRGGKTSVGPSTILTLVLLFFVFIPQGFSVIPYPGIQNDEALFSAGIFCPDGRSRF